MRQNNEYKKLSSGSTLNNFHEVITKMRETTVNQVYKPREALWLQNVLRTQSHLSLHMGDFNKHHQLKYLENDTNSGSLIAWSKSHNTEFVFDAKDRGSSFSDAWKEFYGLSRLKLWLV